MSRIPDQLPASIPGATAKTQLAQSAGPRIDRFLSSVFPQLFEEKAATHAERMAVKA